jgi:hypothetical protein
MTTDNPRIRTSDAERERIAQILREAVGEGRLTLEEGDERLATLYTTKFRDELNPLVADLPAATKASSGGPAAWGSRGGQQRPRTGADAGPVWEATDPTGSGAQRAGGQCTPGWGGPGHFGRHGVPGFGLLRLLTVIAIVVGAVSLLHHGLWFVIPIAFVLLSAGRGMAWRVMRRRRTM